MSSGIDQKTLQMMRFCNHNPCWCGGKEKLDRFIEQENENLGFRPWTQEADDKFRSNEDGHEND